MNEMLNLVVDTVCSKRKTIRIASDDKPLEVVKSVFMKLDREHISFVLDSMKENTTLVRNMKQYLLAALYNAPMTINSHYSSLVQHHMMNESKSVGKCPLCGASVEDRPKGYISKKSRQQNRLSSLSLKNGNK